jgi:hypothetical protein
MLSRVLGSPRAIAINIEIMRTFVKVRALATTHQDLAKRLGELGAKTDSARHVQPQHPRPAQTDFQPPPRADDAARAAETDNRVRAARREEEQAGRQGGGAQKGLRSQFATSKSRGGHKL